MPDGGDYIVNIKIIFRAGDGVTGPKTAIMAIAGGKRAALAMSQYLIGQTITVEKDSYNHIKAKDYKDIDPSTFVNEKNEQIEKIEKVHMPMLTKEQRFLQRSSPRSHNFKEVELGFSEDQAKKEAQRCLQCGCADADECKLRNYAAAYDAKQDAFAGEQITHPIDDSHRYIVRDRNKCILCARCVRICIESGSGVFGFVGRGFDTTVEPPFSLPLGEEKACTSCGLCVSTCPTGALTPRKDVKLPTTAYTDCAHGEGISAGTAVTSISDAVAQTKKAG